MRHHLLTLAAAGALVCNQAAAAVFDFTGLGDDVVVASNPFSLPGGTFSSTQSFYANVNAYFDGQGGSICPLSTSVGNCSANFTIDFDTAVTNLSFYSLTGSSGNAFTVEAFDIGGASLGSLDYSDARFWDFSGVAAPVASLAFTYTSGPSGLAFGRFSFEPVAAPPAAVPEPASLALVALGLALAAGAGRARRA
jgi:hypothetical protein